MPSLRSNTIWALVADGAQLVLGTLAFLALAEILGPAGFGLYSTVLALATFAIPLFSFGAQQILMLGMTDRRPFERLWPSAVATIVIGGVVSTSLAVGVARPLLRLDMSAAGFAALFLAQAIPFAVSEFCLVSAQAHRRMQISAVLRVASGLVRATAVGLFWWWGAASVESWAWFALVGWSVAAALGLTIVRLTFGAFPWGAMPRLADLRRGVPYATGAGSAYALDAADRPMLYAMAGTTETGLYSAAYRLVQMGFTPVMALVKASDADFFSAGARGVDEAWQLAVKLSRSAAAFNGALAVGLIVAAPVVPWLLDDYEGTTSIIRAIAVFPLLKGLQIFPANALTGLGWQSERNLALAGALVVNLSINLALIPSLGWKGAVIATLVAEALMASLLWGFLARARRS